MSASGFVLRGGRLVDGTGAPSRAADIAVTDGVLRVGEPRTVRDVPVVDVEGLVVSPGFIDVHSHADVEPLLHDRLVHESRVTQGVTTEVVGNCGFSVFPVPPASADTVRQFSSLIFGSSAETFTDLDAYATRMHDVGLANNVAPLVGHGTLRAATLGYDNRRATDAELDTMRRALDDAMRAGALGMSTGLCYTPATYAPSDEVESLAAVAAAAGGIYATHVRNETDLASASLAEAIAVAAATSIPLQVSHLKVAGRRQWGTSGDLLAQLDDARAGGVDVTADVYPYTAASTSLHALLPPWTAEHGLDALLHDLSDPAWRARVARDLERGVPGWQNLGAAAGWDNVTIAAAAGRPDWEGRTVTDLGDDRDEHVVDTIARILAGNRGRVVVVIEAMLDGDVDNFLTWPHSVVGSDGIPLPGKPHPRLTGTFPRVLGRYRDLLGGLEQAVHRMTGASAARFAIPSRGTIATGLVADVVVFDERAVIDTGTYAEPWQRPRGIHHVIVGGRVAVWDGEPVSGTCGRVLRRAERR